jgi:hypothetical protein
MTTIFEFIDSTALEDTVVKNCPKYRVKFLNIIDKAGVGDSDTTDKEALKIIRGTRSWNWAAFLFNHHWAIYRKENLLGWGVFAFVWFLSLLSIWVPSLQNATPLSFANPVDFTWLCAAVLTGLYGNSFVLRNSIKIVENTSSPKDREQRSPIGLASAIAIDIVLIGVSYILVAQ